MILSIWTDMFLHKYLIRVDDPDEPIEKIRTAMQPYLHGYQGDVYYYSIDQDSYLDPDQSLYENMIGMNEQIVMITEPEILERGLPVPQAM